MFDLGCGTGRVAEVFKKVWKARVFASDFSKDMLAHAKRCLKERVISEDALNLCWKNGIFDFVNLSWAINHVENYKKAIDEMARAAKPSGYVLITVVNSPKESECKKRQRG